METRGATPRAEVLQVERTRLDILKGGLVCRCG